MLRFITTVLACLLPCGADSLSAAQTAEPKAAPAAAKADPLLGKLVMPTAGAKLKKEQKEYSLRDAPAPFVVRKVEGDWLWIGRAWIRREQVVPLDKALEYYTAWIEKNPKDSWAYDFRATVYHERGNLPQALADHSKAIELSPKDAHYYNNRGLVHFELEKPEAALADYDEALKLDPKYAMAYCNRGALYIGMGDLNKALTDYRSAMESDAECAEACNGVAWIYATSRNPSFRDGAKAVEYAEAAAKLTAYSDLAILDTLAAAYAEAGKWEEAVKYQKKAMEVAGENTAYLTDAQERLKLYEAKKPFRE